MPEPEPPPEWPVSSGPMFCQVVDIKEAINWVAHGNFAGAFLGPRFLLEFSGSNETIEREAFEDLGRQNLAFELIWDRAESGDIKLYGRKAKLVVSKRDPKCRHWDYPEEYPEPIPIEVLSDGSWTEDEGGAIEGEDISYWGVTVDHADLLNCFPSGDQRGPGREVDKVLRGVIDVAQSSAPERNAGALASVETQCRKWIAELAAQGVTPRSREDLFSQALSKFPQGLTRRGFDRCWDNAAPESWKRAGRKPRQD